ncbi:MAG: hypothetical protein SGJ04_04235 [Bacteroidota bacterium]|nr:hypothetical protein [Bacteroidota bacterium]
MENVENLDLINLKLLMDLHLAEKKLLKKTKELLEYEEAKGIFRGFKFNYLLDVYDRKNQMITYLEKIIQLAYPTCLNKAHRI